MMMMFLHCNQRLLTSELYFTSGRVLSIQSNPYQALRLRQQNTNKENSNCNDEKWKWSIWLQQSNLVWFGCNNPILSSSHSDDNEKSKASCPSQPSRQSSHKCLNSRLSCCKNYTDLKCKIKHTVVLKGHRPDLWRSPGLVSIRKEGTWISIRMLPWNIHSEELRSGQQLCA